MTPDDIKVGQLVAVSKHLCAEQDCGSFGGHPFRVAAVSLPFAVLEDCGTGKRSSIDLREWQLTKVTPAYARAMFVKGGAPAAERGQERSRDDGHPRCVRCGERLKQVLKRRCWRWYCERCNSVGDPVEAVK